MRWDALFNDLESQLQAATALEQESEIRERTRAEQARLTLVQRLLGQVGRPLGVSTRGGRSLEGILTNVGSEWIAVAVEGRSVIVPLSSLHLLRGMGRGAGQPLSGVGARLGLGSALRVLSRDRAYVTLWTVSPPSRQAGIIDRVGADFVDVGTTGVDREGRQAQGRDVLTVPFASLDAVDAAAD
ncbi:hypothetical protein C4K88_02675 [Arthrobacter pityocampae]|uniref:Fis family transcriptional regulator n=1 Tax=Arthrobacter pityocampae TaxID=547334 RepID=A0A2S5J1W6_9MICC|nr:hypothetical protein [Arthrobacter pityocampae]PPB50794.1 hypothetical protein C4K88_02675 [Arthrobacter pityocampae]